MLFWKSTLTKKNISYKEKDLIKKVKCFTENDNREVWSERKLLFWLAKDNIGGNQITNEVFSPRISKHKTWIWSTNVQTRCTWKYWLANIRHFQATDTSMLVSIGAHNFTRFCCQFYHSHHLWLLHCFWTDHSQNCWYKQLELLILSIQECMVTSWIFRSQSFFQLLTQCLTKAEMCWRTFCQIRL